MIGGAKIQAAAARVPWDWGPHRRLIQAGRTALHGKPPAFFRRIGRSPDKAARWKAYDADRKRRT